MKPYRGKAESDGTGPFVGNIKSDRTKPHVVSAQSTAFLSVVACTVLYAVNHTERRLVRDSENEADATSFPVLTSHENNKEDVVGNERQTETRTNSHPSEQCWWTDKGV